MAPTNRREVTLYEEAKAGFSSLVRQVAVVFIGFVVMLLVTGGAPSGFVVALSFCLGTTFVAWKEQKRISDLRSTRDRTSSDSQAVSTVSVTNQSVRTVRSNRRNSTTRPWRLYEIPSAGEEDWMLPLSAGEEDWILPAKEKVVTEHLNLPLSAPQESVVEIASELQRLLEQFSQAGPNSTVSERMVVFAKVIEEIERQPQFKQQLIKVLRSGGVEVLRESLKYPDADILLAALETHIDSSTQIDP
jgi:hypothetical protein